MSSLAEAFKKAGMATDEQVDQIQKESRLRELKQTDKFGENQAKKPFEKVTAIANPGSRFTKLFNGEKSQKFMLHVIHAFIPFVKAHYIFDWEDEGFKKKPCDICHHPVMSKVECLEIYHKRGKDWEKDLNQTNPLEFFASSFKCYEGKKIAVVSPIESKVLMCSPCHKEFFDWVLAERDAGNKLINKLIHKIFNKQVRREIFTR